MAAEKDFELLDDFLGNRMTPEEAASFETKLQSDPALKSEYRFQKDLIEGIKQARVTQLKSMLNQAPIPPVSGGSSIIAKFAATIIVASAVGTGLYLWFSDKDETVLPSATEEMAVPPLAQYEESPATAGNEASEAAEAEKPAQQNTAKPEHAPANVQSETEQQQQQPAASATEETRETVRQPRLDIYDPTKDQEVNGGQAPKVEEEVTSSTATPEARELSITVETDKTNKKYTFHYQFNGDRLMLFGPFEEDLYEILEFFSNNKRTIFLFYNNNYYLLDEAQVKPTPLKAITDQALLKKLKDYRGR